MTNAETRLAVASALAPLAVLLVVVSGVSATVASLDDGSDTAGGPAPTSSPSGADGGSDEPTGPPPAPEGTTRVVAASGSASFLVPDDEAWEVRESGTTYGYATGDGDGSALVDGPAILDAGWCEAGVSDRAFAGLTGPGGPNDATVQESAEATASRWSEVVADAGGEGSEPAVSPLRLDDGSAAWSAVVVVTGLASEDECAAPGREVRVVVAQGASGLATLVVSRDVTADGEDLDASLSSEGADEIARSLLPG